MFIDFRGGVTEKEKERNISERNINWLPPTRAPTGNPTAYPDWVSNPQPFFCTGKCSNQLSKIGQGIYSFS